MRGRRGGGGPKSWACGAEARDGQRRGPGRPRPGRGRGTEATAGPRRPGPVQEGRRAGGARRLGQLGEVGGDTALPLPPRPLPPHLQDPDPSRPASCRRFRWLRGLQRARGPGLHLPHWRPRIHRDARPALQRASHGGAREQREASPLRLGPAPSPEAPPLRPRPCPCWTCVAACLARPEQHCGSLAPLRGEPLPSSTLGLEDWEGNLLLSRCAKKRPEEEAGEACTC